MKDKFYNTFKILIVVLILLNLLDSLTTVIGLTVVQGISESNPLLFSFTSHLATIILIKILLLSAMLIGALAYLFQTHHSFPKLWENEVGVGIMSAVVAFYLFVVINNILLITYAL